MMKRTVIFLAVVMGVMAVWAQPYKDATLAGEYRLMVGPSANPADLKTITVKR